VPSTHAVDRFVGSALPPDAPRGEADLALGRRMVGALLGAEGALAALLAGSLAHSVGIGRAASRFYREGLAGLFRRCDHTPPFCFTVFTRGVISALASSPYTNSPRLQPFSIFCFLHKPFCPNSQILLSTSGLTIVVPF